MMKKTIAKLLVFAMLLTMLPFSAMAAANDVTSLVNISEVKVGGQSLSGSASSFSTTGTVTLANTNTVTVSFKAQAKSNQKIGYFSVYKTANDTTNLAQFSNGAYTVNSDITFTAPTSGNKVELTLKLKVNVGSAEKTEDLKLAFNIPAKTYTVTVNKATNGTVTASKTSGLQANEEVTLTVTPDKGYQLDKLTVQDTSKQAVTVTGNKFKMPASNVTVSATFKKAPVAVTGVEVSPTELPLEIKEGVAGTATLTAKVQPADAKQTVTWTSSNEKVATVAGGKVTAVGAGTATITATSTEDVTKKATCEVTVQKAVSATVEVGEVDPEDAKTPEDKDITTAPIGSPEFQKAVEQAGADAKGQNPTSDNKVVAIVSIPLAGEDVDGAELDKSAFSAARTYITGLDTNIELVVSVELEQGTVRLNSQAIKEITEAGGSKVIVSVTKPALRDVPDGKKPAGIKASYDVNITVDGKAVDWSKTGNKITLTVNKPNAVKKLDNIKVYLDDKKADGASVVEKVESEQTKLEIQVPHLTYINLVEETTPSNNNSGGGGGGGSSKPSIKPGGKPSTPGTTAPSGGVAGFNDVAPGAWYADSVKFVVDRGLFGGVGNGRFAPNDNMTRAMMWTVLARYKGVNTNTGSNWYEAARAWAIAQGISDGTMADGNVTREQFVTMLWRLSGEPTVNNAASFTDSGKVSGYAKAAVDWAVAQGIVNGYSDGTFKPQGSATRAEVAKMLTVFVQNEENA